MENENEYDEWTEGTINEFKRSKLSFNFDEYVKHTKQFFQP